MNAPARLTVDRDSLDGTATITPSEARQGPAAGPTFADVLRTFSPAYRKQAGDRITRQQDKVLRELMACYTPLMGTHEWTCEDCATVVVLPNGCNNRHCCTCGWARRHSWAAATCSRLFPVPYYHVILTVPAPITRLAMLNPRLLYSMILRVGAESVRHCGRRLFQIELALISLLHTWGQLLNDHLHTHSLLAAGGLERKTLEWIDLSAEQMAQLLECVSQVFAKRFCQALRKTYDQGQLQFDGDRPSPAAFERWLEPLENRSWIIRCPQVWDRRCDGQDPEATLKTVLYLAHYANRIALSDRRILDIQGNQVLFAYKDYRDGDAHKRVWIDGVELIGRFLRHLLPPRMHHIRLYGWMSRHTNPAKLDRLREHFEGGADYDRAKVDQAEQTEETEPPDEDRVPSQRCRYCQGRMHVTGRTARPRVHEMLRMPLAWFQRAKAGPIITVVPRIATGLPYRVTPGQAVGKPRPPPSSTGGRQEVA